MEMCVGLVGLLLKCVIEIRSDLAGQLLNLWDNKIGALGGEAIGKGLDGNTKIQSLNLR